MQVALGINPELNIIPHRYEPPNYQNRNAVLDAFANTPGLGAPPAPAAATAAAAAAAATAADIQHPAASTGTAAAPTDPSRAQNLRGNLPTAPITAPTPINPVQQAPPPPAATLTTAAATAAPPHQAMDEDTRRVMQASRANRTRRNYEDGIARLCRFLFDNAEAHPGIISPELMGDMLIAHQDDQNRRTAKGKPSKMRTSINECIKTAIRRIQPSVPATFPVNFDSLTFHVYTEYLKTFGKSVTTKRGAADNDVLLREVFGDDSDHSVEGFDDGIDEDGVGIQEGERTRTYIIRLGHGAYSSARSALAFLYGECGVSRDFSDNTKYLWKQLPIYQKGSARTAALQREALGLRTVEGKDPFPFPAYELLSGILFRSKDPEHVALHLFLLLEWNLMSRAEQAVDANIELVGVYNDALRFFIGKSKGNQEGTKHIDHPWHVYSVPSNPVICPVLAFTKHLIANPQILNGRRKLFDGVNQYERFNKMLGKIIKSPEYRDEFIRLKMPPAYFGTHSIRKGAATFCATGVTSSPPIASICIRCDWKMPGVMNRYIRFENAGDMYVGRSVCGRNRLGKDFAESLPYFDFSDDDPHVKAAKHREIDLWMKRRMPLDAQSNDNVMPLLKTCIASLAYHREFLDANLHHRNAITASPFYSEPIPHASNTTTRYPWNYTDDTPKFTGLPVDVMYMERLERLRAEVETMKTTMLADHERIIEVLSKHIDEALDMRSIGGLSGGISDELKKLAGKMDEVLARMNNPMLSPEVTTTEQNAIGGIIEYNYDVVEEDDIVLTVEETANMQHHLVRQRSQTQYAKRRFKAGYCKGRWTTVPNGWVYPEKMNLIQMITLFLMGNPAEHVPPLKTLSPKDVNHCDRGGADLSRMKRLMKVVKYFACKRGVWKPLTATAYWNGETVTKLWDGIWNDLMPHLLTITQLKSGKISHHKSRVSTLSWRTMHDKLMGVGGLFEQLHI